MPETNLRAAQRLWLYASVERNLLAAAMASGVRGSSLAMLTGGCGHSLRATTAWAMARGLEPAPVCQALAARGGFCDCEVLLNAAHSDDDELEAVLIAGEVVGLSALFDVALAAEGEPDPIAVALEAGALGEVLRIERDGDRAAVSPQAVDSGVVPRLLDVLTTGGSDGIFALVYPDAGDAADLVIGRGGRVTVQPVDSADAPAWVGERVARMRAASPPPAPATAPGRLGLPVATGSPQLLFHGTGDGGSWQVWSKGATTELDLRGDDLAIDPGRDHAAWKIPFRKSMRLVIEDLARGQRRQVAGAGFTGDVAFAPGGRVVYTVRDGIGVAIDVDTGDERRLGPARRVIPSPDGELLAIETRDGFTVQPLTGGDGAPVIAGRGVVWSPDGQRLVFSAKVDGEGFQLHLLERTTGQVRRLSPPCAEAVWPSFTDGGDAVVATLFVTRYRTPLPDGRTRLEDDEALVRCPVDGSAPVTLWESRRGYRRIVQPLAHPRAPLVAFRTQNAPQVGTRLVVIDGSGQIAAIAAGMLSPVAWLG